MTRVPAAPVVVVNNSQETFSATSSGAIATCIHELCLAAARRGEHPVVVTSDRAGDPLPWDDVRYVRPSATRVDGRIRRALCHLAGWERSGQRAFARRTLAEIRRIGAKVVICNNDPEIAAYLSHRLPDATVVHWFHNLMITSGRVRRRFWAADGLRSVAVSAYLARAVEAAYRLDPLSVPVVFPGVDSDAFAPGGSGRAREVPVVGFVGRICVEKAPDTLLRACLVLADDGRQFAVHLVGDTNWGRSARTPTRVLVDELVADLRRRGVDVRTRGHVVRAEVPAAFRQADIHVVPSRWDEPFGLTTLEGLATGIPVVATATGGSPEVLGPDGLLVPRDDPAALAAVLGRLLDAPDRCRALGLEARRRAESFTWEATWLALSGATAGQPVLEEVR